MITTSVSYSVEAEITLPACIPTPGFLTAEQYAIEFRFTVWVVSQNLHYKQKTCLGWDPLGENNNNLH